MNRRRKYHQKQVAHYFWPLGFKKYFQLRASTVKNQYYFFVVTFFSFIFNVELIRPENKWNTFARKGNRTNLRSLHRFFGRGSTTACIRSLHMACNLQHSICHQYDLVSVFPRTVNRVQCTSSIESVPNDTVPK